MGRNTNKNDAPLAKINEPTIEVKLYYQQIQNVENHCNILKDFVFTPTANGRKLHKNSKILSEKFNDLSEQGQQLNERRMKLMEMQNAPGIKEDEKKELQLLMDDLIKETVAFNKARHEIWLYPVLIAEYPTDPEKFGMKKVPQNGGAVLEIPYYTSFMELTDVILID